MEENTTLKEEIRKLSESLEGAKIKSRKFKLPYKARVGRKRLKEGYATIAVISENKNIDFTREPIIDSTIKVKDTFHAIASEDVFFYKGKPFVFQAKNKINPFNPLTGQNETYGQKYVVARMEGDKIITKKSLGWGMGIGALIIVGIIAYAVITGG